MARWRFCNVLQPGSEIRNLWQFSATGKFNLQRHETKLRSEPLSPKLVSRDWQTLVQPRLDVAWLSSPKVFLRVIQLPKADLAETQSMIDLQLEKLSPLPVAQIVWGFEIFPTDEPDMQTVVVMIVPRSQVDDFLGKLEGQGYMADRLEVPLLDQLRATKVSGNGAWIYPGVNGDEFTCLIAWWYHGTLRNLSLIHLPAESNRGEVLQHQLAQMTWAGELEGWLTSPPRYHLVATAETAEVWKTFFTSEQPVEVVPPVAPTDLAGLTARRAVAGEPRTNLLPPEYATRYRQQFIDRLWMRGLGAVVMIYVFLTAAYLLWVQFEKWRFDQVAADTASIAPNYTNTIRLKERLAVMRDQLELQYAALECYKAVAEALPAELTVESMSFDRGRKLSLQGTAGPDDGPKVFEFHDSLRKHTVKGQPFFKNVELPRITGAAPGAPQSRWVFTCDLRRTEIE